MSNQPVGNDNNAKTAEQETKESTWEGVKKLAKKERSRVNKSRK